MAEVPRPFPQPDRDTAPFWDAQNDHVLKFQRCGSCAHVRYPVGPSCPSCRSLDFEWIASGGKGLVYSYTVVHYQSHPAFQVPYTVALVGMEEGPRVIAQLRVPEGVEFGIGTRVRVQWEDYEKQSLPVFAVDGEGLREH